ncbi:MAG TPA: type II secretion system ATPase GspE [Burkholderiales bacterium]|nr:type II secretion system ATPase GspE [Burkholderiales bacterium]
MPNAPASTTHVEPAPSELDPDFARRLPYHFARENGVIAARARDDGAEIWVRAEVTTATLGEVRRTLGRPLRPVMLDAEAFAVRLAQAYTREESSAAGLIGDIEGAGDLRSLADGLPVVTDLLETEDDAPIIRFLNTLLTQALRDRASDIHIEAFEGRSLVRFRIDGTLREVLEPPRALHAALVSRVKVMAELDIAEKRLPQDGRITLRIAGRPVDVRVSTLPTGHGERVVLRLLDKQAGVLDFAALGMSEQTQKRMDELVRQAHGIVLVTGPTGSGKTTTLYAALSRLDADRLNIMTVEDPIEYDLDGIGQTQVNAGIDMTFARALRAILRQDPDVVMIGEIRDLETARIAVQASLTGHLVLATLHTNDAVGAVTRLIDMGIEPFLLSSSLLGVMAQRLVRRLCPDCRRAAPANAAQRAELPPELADVPLPEAVGCAVCKGTGYRGRTGIYEMVIVDRECAELIRSGASEQQLRDHNARQYGGNLRADGMRWIAAGATTLDEVLRVTRAGAEGEG